jgi:tagatose 6-phosphate kinase
MTRIVTLTPNPAIDITYEVSTAPVPGQSVRVNRVRERAGGKGVNVAAVARQLGASAVVLAPTVHASFREGLDRLGLEHHLVPALDTVRRTIAVVASDGATTMLLEPGDPAPADFSSQLTGALDASLAPLPGADPPQGGAADAERSALNPRGGVAGADRSALNPRGGVALVISGSVPPGVDPGLPGRLAELAVSRGVPVIADVSGAALRSAAGSGAILMPNRDELAELTGVTARDVAEVAECARKLVGEGAAAVVTTLGPDGLVAVTPSGAWRVRAPALAAGNPTGAGDAAAAALALHLAAGANLEPEAWKAALVDVVATSAACVLRPVAGEIDPDARDRFLREITVEELR